MSSQQKIEKHNPSKDMTVKAFFDEDTYTVSYVVSCDILNKAVIIDSVLDYDQNSGRTSTASADAVIDYVSANDLTVEWILETHIHADHLSAAPYLKEKLGGQIAVGSEVTKVQGVFGKLFNVSNGFEADGSQFDLLLDDGETLRFGTQSLIVMHTPGHTPACSSYIIGDTCFVGDTLFMPDFGTARCDFPGGDAGVLYNSIQRILALPDETRLFLCHDYKAPGRDYYAWETTVREQRENNIHLTDGEGAFIAMRKERDSKLDMPKLILPSVQVNMRAGHLPPAEDNGTAYLKIPINAV